MGIYQSIKNYFTDIEKKFKRKVDKGYSSNEISKIKRNLHDLNNKGTELKELTDNGLDIIDEYQKIIDNPKISDKKKKNMENKVSDFFKQYERHGVVYNLTDKVKKDVEEIVNRLEDLVTK